MKKEQGYQPDSREAKRAALISKVQETIKEGASDLGSQKKRAFLEKIKAEVLMNASIERSQTPEGESEIKIKLELGGHSLELIGRGGKCVTCAVNGTEDESGKLMTSYRGSVDGDEINPEVAKFLWKSTAGGVEFLENATDAVAHKADDNIK